MRHRYGLMWCAKVLPLVYDESLSYYELLCKVYDYINNLIESDKAILKEIDELKQALAELQEWIDNFNTCYIQKLVDDYVASMIFVQISKSGYFIYYIPWSWKNITFNTTGLDINIEEMPEYGHLVLSY